LPIDFPEFHALEYRNYKVHLLNVCQISAYPRNRHGSVSPAEPDWSPDRSKRSENSIAQQRSASRTSAAFHPEYCSPLILLPFLKTPGQAQGALEWSVIHTQAKRSILEFDQTALLCGRSASV
jgi:hypothetical protein